MPLNERQEQFCQEYVKDHNAAAAYKRAGYSPKTAKEGSARLLTNVNVEARVKQLQSDLSEKHEDDKEKIIEELRKIAFQDAKEIYDFNQSGVEIKDSAEANTKLISEIHVTESNLGVNLKVKTWDKTKALQMLMKFYGMVEDKVNHSGEVITKIIKLPKHEFDGDDN